MTAEELRHNRFYQAVRESAQISIVEDEVNPAVGWFVICPLGQSGPYPTPEAALAGLLCALYQRIRTAEAC